jgi:predicted RNA-binding Zn-ribbon protein involved in translation (DUF1610 family)
LHFHRGVDWYRSHFPVSARRTFAELAGKDLLTFEATPYYLFHPHAPRRAAGLLPNARLIVLLRDPVERAYSHHQHMTRHGHEHLSFADAVAAEEERIGAETARLLADPSYVSLPHHRYSYVARGHYADQLERWLEHFPRERFLILQSEDLYAEPKTMFRAVLDFLGLPPWEPWSFRNHSYVDGRRPGGATVDPGLRESLRTHFAQANAGRLCFIGRGNAQFPCPRCGTAIARCAGCREQSVTFTCRSCDFGGP